MFDQRSRYQGKTLISKCTVCKNIQSHILKVVLLGSHFCPSKLEDLVPEEIVMLNISRIAWVDFLAPFLIAVIFLLSYFAVKLVLAGIHQLHCVIDWFDVFDE